MATLPCTVDEFNQGFVEFHNAIGFKNNTQDGIANMYKGLCLMYLGLINPTEEELENAARLIDIASHGALARGWHLVVPEEMTGAE